MADLFDRFESEDTSRSHGGVGRESALGRGGGQHEKGSINPFDEIDIRGSLTTVNS